jgi:hypothetical protein
LAIEAEACIKGNIALVRCADVSVGCADTFVTLIDISVGNLGASVRCAGASIAVAFSFYLLFSLYSRTLVGVNIGDTVFAQDVRAIALRSSLIRVLAQIFSPKQYSRVMQSTEVYFSHDELQPRLV